jgi:hypothetical protein
LDHEPGVAFAAGLAWIPEAPELAPTLDRDNVGRRLGFGVFQTSPWHLAGVFQTYEQAELEQETLGLGYEIAWGTHQLGSDNFISLK